MELKKQYRELTDILAVMLKKAVEKYKIVHKNSGAKWVFIENNDLNWILKNIKPGADPVMVMQALQIAHKTGVIPDYIPAANNKNMDFDRLKSQWYSNMKMNNLLKDLTYNNDYSKLWEEQISGDIKKRKIHDEIVNINGFEDANPIWKGANKLYEIRIACTLDKMGLYKESDEIINELLLT
jgi:hypothetical protein